MAAPVSILHAEMVCPAARACAQEAARCAGCGEQDVVLVVPHQQGVPLKGGRLGVVLGQPPSRCRCAQQLASVLAHKGALPDLLGCKRTPPLPAPKQARYERVSSCKLTLDRTLLQPPTLRDALPGMFCQGNVGLQPLLRPPDLALWRARASRSALNDAAAHSAAVGRVLQHERACCWRGGGMRRNQSQQAHAS